VQELLVSVLGSQPRCRDAVVKTLPALCQVILNSYKLLYFKFSIAIEGLHASSHLRILGRGLPCFLLARGLIDLLRCKIPSGVA